MPPTDAPSTGPAPAVDEMAPVAPLRHHEPLEIARDTYLIRSMFGEGQGPVAVYVNSMVITDPEPIVVDTGTAVNRDQWMADVASLVDLEDVRYVFLSHDDHDHVGNLVPILQAAPQATLLTTWFSQERLAGDLHVPLSRVRWVNDGDTIDVGGRTLVAIRPPLFDAPTTRGLFDPASGVYWAVDTYGVPVTAPADDVADLDRGFWDEQFLAFNRSNSPWHVLADPVLFGREVDRVERLGATVLASAHGPVVTGANVAEAHAKMRLAAGGEATPLPTQADLDALIAGLVPTTDPEPVQDPVLV
jgi:flavorubredoxin